MRCYGVVSTHRSVHVSSTGTHSGIERLSAHVQPGIRSRLLPTTPVHPCGEGKLCATLPTTRPPPLCIFVERAVLVPEGCSPRGTVRQWRKFTLVLVDRVLEDGGPGVRCLQCLRSDSDASLGCWLSRCL